MCRRGNSDFAAQAAAITVRPKISRTLNIVGFKIFDYYKLDRVIFVNPFAGAKKRVKDSFLLDWPTEGDNEYSKPD